MINPIFRNILRMLFFILLQGLVVNRLDLFQGMVLPSVYIFALLMLPLETPRLLLLFIGFVVGIGIDAFTNTLGMHTSACVLLAFLQPAILRILAPREGYEFGQRPTIQHLGLSWYLTYAAFASIVHHSWLFFIEAFSFEFFGHTLAKIFFSSLATVFLMVLGQYLIFSPDQRKAT